MGKAELPLHAPGHQGRPRLHRPERAAAERAAPAAGARRLRRRPAVSAPRARGVLQQPLRSRADQEAWISRKHEIARRDRSVRRPDVAEYCTPWVGGARAPEGHQVAAAARDRDRARLLAGRGGGGGGRRDARAGRGRGGADRGGVGGTARRRRHGGIARGQAKSSTRSSATTSASSASTTPAAWTRPSRRPTWWSRRPSTSAATPASASKTRSILADYNAAEHSLTVYHSTQAPHMMQDIFSRHLGIPEAQRAGDREGRRRLLRHQGARLSRRDGDRGALGDAAPAGEVRRRPAGVLRYRHPRARAQGQSKAGVHEGGRNPRLRPGRPDRDRAVLGLSAHQRHRGQPGGQPDRRPVQAPEVPREAERRVHQQERHLPVPRGRPSDRGGADRGHRRPGGGEARHGSGGVPPQEPDPRRRLSVHVSVRHQVREALAPPDAG